jgi:hypothetical protein
MPLVLLTYSEELSLYHFSLSLSNLINLFILTSGLRRSCRGS